MMDQARRRAMCAPTGGRAPVTLLKQGPRRLPCPPAFAAGRFCAPQPPFCHAQRRPGVRWSLRRNGYALSLQEHGCHAGRTGHAGLPCVVAKLAMRSGWRAWQARRCAAGLLRESAGDRLGARLAAFATSGGEQAERQDDGGPKAADGPSVHGASFRLSKGCVLEDGACTLGMALNGPVAPCARGEMAPCPSFSLAAGAGIGPKPGRGRLGQSVRWAVS